MGSKRRVVVEGKTKCSCCGKMKLLEDYFKASNKGELGIESACKICATERKRKRKKHKEKEFSRVCKRCEEQKDIFSFEKRNRVCNSCKETPLPKSPNYADNWRKSNKKNSEKLEKRYIIEVAEEIEFIFSQDTEEEIWKYIPNFNNKYQASDLGRIRCLPTVYRTPNDSLRKTSYYIVKSSRHQGYAQTPLTDINGKVHYKGTHRWVMYAFHGESELQVDHINGIRDDNRLINLRYATARENNNYRKDNIPDYFTSSLYGVYKQGKGWTSYIKINGEDYYLGNYSKEIDAHNIYMKAWKDWEELGKLPEKYVNPNKTSQIDGIDFHGASNKWRVRLKDGGLYIGIFETEKLAERVLNIVLYLMKRGIKIEQYLIKKIRKKYTTDNRFRYLINIETGEEFHCLETASKSLNISPSALHSKLNKNLVNDTPIRYK